MTCVDFYEPAMLDDETLIFAVVAARYHDHWVFCRHKQRSTWEIPGGHREAGETIREAALRELKEETGAVEAELAQVCAYQVDKDKCGMLFFAQITELGELSERYEIKEILLSDKLPQALTYPDIQPKLFERVQAWLNTRTNPEEIWDIYDSDRNLTGRLHRRGDPLSKGEYHLVVHVWMQNSAGDFLLTKRSPNKGYPNMWETTGGSAQSGDDSMTAALREVKEETGLTLDPKQGRRLITYQREDAFVDVWLFSQEYGLEEVSLQPGETVEASYVSVQKMQQLMEAGELVPYPYLEQLFRKAGI